MFRTLSWVVFLAPLFASLPAGAEVFQATPDNYRSLLSSLSAGDTLQLAAGSYTEGLPLTDMLGEEAAPITITGPEHGDPAVLVGNGSRNTVSIRRSAFVVLRYLTIDGQQIAHIDAIKSEGSAGNYSHHITIEHNTITGHDANQQTVGISTKSPVWNWTIRHNTIHSAGTGLYLGNSNGEAPFIGGTIEHNLVLHPVGYCMQIKHQNPRPTLPGMPTTSSVTLIRHNVFIKNDAPSDSGDRPNVLLGHFPLTGVGVDDRYEVYGNFFFHNPREALFQGEGNIHLHDNIFVDAGAGWPAINIRPHNDVPRDILIYHNTVYAAETGIRLTGADSGLTQAIMGNAIFADTAISADTGVRLSNNLLESIAAAQNYLAYPSLQLEQMDLYPAADTMVGASIDVSMVAQDRDHNRDFNGTVKDFTYRGAYQGGEVANPGWHLAAALKESVPSTPDAGVVDSSLLLDASEGDTNTAPEDAGYRDSWLPADATNRADSSRSGSEDPQADCGCSSSETAAWVWGYLLLVGSWGVRRWSLRIGQVVPETDNKTTRS